MHARTNDRPPCSNPPLVILVHGLVISSRYMIPTARHLLPSCRVYAVDLPGYGRSYKPRSVLRLDELADCLAEWMDRLALPKANLVANSFGCQILAEFALRHPEKVERLVLQGPTVDPAARSLRQQIRLLMRNSPHEPRSLGWITLIDYLSAGLPRAWATMKLALEDKIEEKLPQIQHPTLIVRGEKDPLVSQRWAEELVSLLPNGKLRLIPEAWHTVNYAAPAEFVAAITPFLGL